MNKRFKRFIDALTWPILVLNIPVIGFMLWLTWDFRYSGWPVAAMWFLAYCITLYCTQRLIRTSESILQDWDETIEALKESYRTIEKMRLEIHRLKEEAK